MQKSLLQLYLERCAELRMHKHDYIAEKFQSLEQEPSIFIMPANWDKKLLATDEVLPTVGPAFRPAIIVFTQLPLLKILNLAHQQLGDEQIILLLGSLHQAGCRLEEFDISDNQLGCLSAKMVFQYCGSVRKCNLSQNNIGDSGVQAAAEQQKQYMFTDVLLSSCGITARGLAYLKLFVEKCSCLLTLSLKENNLDASDHTFLDYQQFIEVIEQQGVVCNLDQCFLTKLQTLYVRTKIQRGDVVKVSLKGNGLDIGEMQKYSQMIVQNSKWRSEM